MPRTIAAADLDANPVAELLREVLASEESDSFIRSLAAQILSGESTVPDDSGPRLEWLIDQIVSMRVRHQVPLISSRQIRASGWQTHDDMVTRMYRSGPGRSGIVTCRACHGATGAVVYCAGCR